MVQHPGWVEFGVFGVSGAHAVDDIKSCVTFRTLSCGNYGILRIMGRTLSYGNSGIFLTMGNAGLISSTVHPRTLV